MSFDRITNYFQFGDNRRVLELTEQATQIIEDEELNHTDKINKLLSLEMFKQIITSSSAEGNSSIQSFLFKKESMELLIKYSIGVPTDPLNKKESYK
jgi:hypothetical protein